MIALACERAVGSTGSLISSFTWSGVMGVRYFSLLLPLADIFILILDSLNG